MIVLIDNFDSFTHNLAKLIEEVLDPLIPLKIVRNTLSLEEIISLNPQALILSPGPGNPQSAGVTLQAIHHFSSRIPILGICLGHQAIIESMGGKIIRAPKPVHGKRWQITHTGKGLFKDVPSPIVVARYHSLAACPISWPPSLIIDAITDDDEKVIMGFHHESLPLFGVQFHPESILSSHGVNLVNAFLEKVLIAR